VCSMAERTPALALEHRRARPGSREGCNSKASRRSNADNSSPTVSGHERSSSCVLRSCRRLLNGFLFGVVPGQCGKRLSLRVTFDRLPSVLGNPDADDLDRASASLMVLRCAAVTIDPVGENEEILGCAVVAGEDLDCSVERYRITDDGRSAIEE
jgi:hypothetical protein